ncbi:MAG: YoaK family protein [Alphaproteobacteria bacterium]
MDTLNKNIYMLAACLSALAGFVDAVGFMYLGGYFISFMSGNSTRLSVTFIGGEMNSFFLLFGIIFLFVMGAMLGSLVRHFTKAPPVAVSVLVLLTVLLFAAAISFEMGFGYLAIMLMTLAMGAENSTFQRGGDMVVGLTYMSGTLVKLGQKWAEAITGGRKTAWIPYLLLWLGLIAGGALGALSFQAFGLHSLWVATFVSLLLTSLTAWKKLSL